MTTTAKLSSAFSLLKEAGLRPTRQRCALAAYLFGGKTMHVTAESVHISMGKGADGLSLATVYNNLHQFTEAGLLHKVTLDPERLFFDTNTALHHHLYDEETEELIDIPLCMVCLPPKHKIPPQHKIKHVDVVIRMARELLPEETIWPSCSLKGRRRRKKKVTKVTKA